MNTRTGLLPRRVKAGYGTAEWGMSSAEVVLQIYLLLFYTQHVGLSAEWTGYALALAVLWDGITDPIMGFMSDRTRSRFGKRSPWIAAGAVGLAAAFLALFFPPPMETQWQKFLYLLGSYMAVSTTMTLISVPHAALGGELSEDRNERNEIFGWRMLGKYGGFLLAVVLLGITTGGEGPSGAAGTSGAGLAAVGIAIAVVGSAALSLYSVRGLDTPGQRTPEQGRGLWAGIKAFVRANFEAICNPVFAPLLAAFAIAQVGRTINASLALQYYTAYLHLTEPQVLLGILVPFVLFASPSIVVWVLLARRFGKKRPAFWGALLLGLFTVVTYPLLPAGVLWAPIVFSAGFGGFLVSSIILFDSLVADIADYDELRSGLHREGLYFGVWTLATKASRALGLAATGQMLGLIGYQEGVEEQSAAVAWRLALLFGPVVGACFMAAAVVFLLMPLTGAKHKQVQRLLHRRREKLLARESATSGHE
ncbi:MAG: MFS transporter [Candidatus Hydrogenedens sp.]|nr:MFS transporter [Candidatus Hydrogenedens sp.]